MHNPPSLEMTIPYRVHDSGFIQMRNISKNSFIEALEARKDDVYVRILQDLSSLDCIRCEDLKILYHRACYKSYTSRRNVKYFDDSLIIFENSRFP
jgi:hypothetical protein